MARPNLALRHPEQSAMLAEVEAGLARPQKELSPKFFYDHRGSVLFEEITLLPEYYLTRAERALLARWAPAVVRTLGAHSLVELGAGSADKTRVLLDALCARVSAPVYVPIDVSAAFLGETAQRLRKEYPQLRVLATVADITDDWELPRDLPAPVLYAFLGSTIGNFNEDSAVRLLGRVRERMRPKDRLLLGVDLRKDVAVLEAAYNNARGVTAEFNRNALRVVNHELGADFDPDAFEHRAFYNRSAHRIEMHLVSRRDQTVDIPGMPPVHLSPGESIRTEISCKYDPASVRALYAAADLTLCDWRTDALEQFALAVGAPA